MTFIVNSSPGAGLRFVPSATFNDAKAALEWADNLQLRGMRLIRIRDTAAQATYDQKGLRDEIEHTRRVS
ncbi:MAG: hypothetical protein NW206_12480 [Hyphomonadaceae bacterium]|nr:hypothetical protein [Hyphomonadaceae bacterium]